MKKIFYLLSIAVLFTSISITSCTKDDDNNTGGVNDQNSNSVIPIFDKPSCVLTAGRYVMLTNLGGFDIPMKNNIFSANFYKDTGNVMVDAGIVKVNDKVLESDGSHVYQLYEMLVQDELTNIKWDVSGSADVAAFTKNITKGLPSFTNYELLPLEISKSEDLNINLTGKITNADSVILVLADTVGANVLVRRGAINDINFLFHKSDLSSFPLNSAFISVIAYNSVIEADNNRNKYFLNQNTVLRTTKIKE